MHMDKVVVHMKTVLNAFERLAKRQIVKKKIAVELGVDKTTANFF